MIILLKRLMGHDCGYRVRQDHVHACAAHRGWGRTLKNQADRVTFPLGASYLLVVSAFFFFYLLLGLFPLLLQLVLLLLIPLLLRDIQRTSESEHCTHHWEVFPSSKAPCTTCCKTFFMSDRLESKAFTS